MKASLKLYTISRICRDKSDFPQITKKKVSFPKARIQLSRYHLFPLQGQAHTLSYNSIVNLNRHSNVVGFGMDNLLAYQKTSGGRMLLQGQAEGSHQEESETWLWVQRLPISKKMFKRHGTAIPTVASGRVQLRRMTSATACRMGDDLVLGQPSI
jgi:hypothetical protein